MGSVGYSTSRRPRVPSLVVTAPPTGAGSGTVTSVNVAATGFSSSGAVTGAGTVTLTRNGLELLPENTGFLLDVALSADGKFTVIEGESGTAGEALSVGHVCIFNSSSKWVKADASAIATAGGELGVCILAAAGDAAATRMMFRGNIRADAVFPTFTPGDAAYLSLTAGEITATPPSATDEVVRRIGWARSADSIRVDISPNSLTVA